MTSRSTFDLGIEHRQDGGGHVVLSGDITSSSSDVDGDSNQSGSMFLLDTCHKLVEKR